jgi:aspartate aminotransferase
MQHTPPRQRTARHARPPLRTRATTPATPLALAPAVRTLPPSATLRMNELVAARRAAGQETIHLGFGEASFPLAPQLHAALDAAATQTGYPPVLGVPALRAALADYLSRTRGVTLGAAQIAVGPGSKPLLYVLLQALEGDALIPAPGWVSYAPQARLAGKRVIPVATDERDHLRLTGEALARASARARHEGANPRILIVNSPSNPTGGMLAPDDVADLAEWARGEGITILSDEIYAELAHGWRPHVSVARHYPEGTVVTGGLSKAYSAGGWRLGYAAVPAGAAGDRLISAIRALASEVWSGAAAPIQAAAAVAYSPDPELERYVWLSARLHGYVAARLHAALVASGMLCPRPAGAFYLYPDFAPWRETLASRGIVTGADLARHLLEDWGIATLPGSEFGDHPEALRLRLATSLLFEPERTASPEARAQWLWDLLAQADTLADGDTSGQTPALTLPMLDRAIARLGELTASLGAPGAG